MNAEAPTTPVAPATKQVRPLARKPRPASSKPKAASKRPQTTVVTTTAKTKSVAAAAPEKSKKPKLVRDGFTMPKDEFALIDSVKQRAARGGHAVKKSEVLRAGLAMLAGLDDKALLAQLKKVPALKTGRPKKT